MSAPANNAAASTTTYGFLCEETNVFYAFETFEEYQEFLTWLQRGSSIQGNHPENQTMTDEELRINSDRVTENIMEVFNDPIFTSEGKEMELEEIDFWRIIFDKISMINIHYKFILICLPIYQNPPSVVS